MIDEYYTWKIFGYHIDELSHGSNKPIVVRCDDCCEYRVVRNNSYHDLCQPCSHKGVYPNESTRRKMSLSHQGQKRTKQQCINMSNGAKGRKMPPRTNEHRRNLSESGKRRPPRSQEWCDKISNARIGHLVPEEQRCKQSATMQGIPYEEWTGFVRYGGYCEKFDEACRERIRVKYDRKCFLCGADEISNEQKLCVHHIDQNKSQGCDGVQWKLVPLCRACHGRSHSKMWKTRIEYLLAIEVIQNDNDT